MKGGDVVTVAATGDYGKPRPAVIVQTDALPAAHASVVSRDSVSHWHSSWAWPTRNVVSCDSQR